MDREIVIGLTGLSRSGKTTFIAATTHLLENLEGATGDNVYTEPLVRGASPDEGPKDRGFFRDKTEISVEVSKRDAQSVSREAFPYRDVFAALAGEGEFSANGPGWPERTQGLSEIEINISYLEYIRSWSFKKKPKSKSISIRMIDYPGEWIADLMLLSMTYGEWCEYCREFFQEGAIAAHSDAQYWAERNKQLDPAQHIDAPALTKLAEPYESLLKKLHREDAAQSMLSPGRLITSDGGTRGDAAMFFPLLECGPETADEKLAKDSLFRRLESRYERYKKSVVQPFVKNNFAGVTDQIVLVDCVRAVEEGADAVRSLEKGVQRMQRAISATNHSLATWLWSWVGGGGSLKRVYFVATKADLVIKEDVGRLKQLMKRFGNHIAVDSESAMPTYHALASVRTTRWSSVSEGRRQRSTVAGFARVDNDGEDVRDVTPSRMKQATQHRVPLTDGEIRRLEKKNFLRFDNPGLDKKNGNMLPSLNVAELLNDLLHRAV